jgi:Ran GTPase-activating protein (RanGAP) involved in mRNA processing and transport/GTPase SAR1 family protein
VTAVPNETVALRVTTHGIWDVLLMLFPSLELDWNNVGKETTGSLAKALESNRSLTLLKLEANEIGKEGAEALAKALETNRSLTSLVLLGNKIGKEGAEALAKALETNRSLTWLGLGKNNIGNEGAVALAKALETNRSLMSLELEANEIGKEGAVALAKALETNRSLTWLGLGKNNIGNEGAVALAKTLERNGSLTSLELKANEIGKEGTESLAKALETNASLTSLNLCTNNIGKEGAEALLSGQATEYMFNNKKMSWKDHEDAAIEWGGHLASIHSMEEHEHVKNLAKGEFWIGGRRIESHKGNDPGSEHWKWADGSPWDFTLWAPGEPNNCGNQKNRVQMCDWCKYKWNDCKNMHPQAAVYKRYRAITNLEFTVMRAAERNKRLRTERKRKANELLASETVTAEDLQALLDANGTLDASPMLGPETVLDNAQCVKAVTRHAAEALQSCGIKCLDLQGNKHLVTLPARELCRIDSLKALQCRGCSSITNIPQSVSERGGEEAMVSLRYSSLTADLTRPMKQEDYGAAHALFTSLVASLPPPTRQLLQVKLDKIEASILLASELESAKEGFQRLMRDGGTLDASPMFDGEMVVANELCVKAVTRHAAEALQSCGIKCLNLQSNPHLVSLPAKELCAIASLVKVECANCAHLGSPPVEVAEQGGEETMKFLRECAKNGATNGSMTIVFLGDGEVGKTSVRHAIQNEQGNAAPRIGKDTRTVGMDTVIWNTKDARGQDIEFRIQDVAGQKVYRKGLEFFLVTRAVYLFLYRADSVLKNISESVTQWLNMLQACVPGVTVLPVVTHIDCVSTGDLGKQVETVQGVFEQWAAKQKSLPNPQGIPLVRILYNGKSRRVNCLSGEGIADLRADMLKTAETTRGFRELLPKPWLDLRQAMRELQKRRKFITWNEYQELALICGITEDRLLAATSFLHDTLEIRDFGLSERRRKTENLEDFLIHVLRQPGERDKIQDARALFDRIDTDGSGAINIDELRAFAQKHGLGTASIDLLMQSAVDDGSGEIEFREFYERFQLAQSAALSNVLMDVIYLNLEWMIDVVKGVVRHDTSALLQFLQDKGLMELQHMARRMRVQGIVAQDLIDRFLLWPGNPDSEFWSKVDSYKTTDHGSTDKTTDYGFITDKTRSYKYERGLWLDSAKNLKNVVESAEHKMAAVGLLIGFKFILRLNAKELYCADIVPKHSKDTIHGLSLDTVQCAYWMTRTYFHLPSGFWNTLFMELRSLATSGSNSSYIQTVFLLSAKIQILQTQDDDDRIQIDVRASTSKAFEVALNALATVAKFYRGMALWESSTEKISAEDIAKIVEPAQVLVMTAAPLVCKSAAAIESFNTALSNFDGAPGLVKQEFIEEARTRADGPNPARNRTVGVELVRGEMSCQDHEDAAIEWGGHLASIHSMEEHGNDINDMHPQAAVYKRDGGNKKVQAVRSKLEALRERLNTAYDDHFTGSRLLAEIIEDVNGLSEGVVLPEYRRYLRGLNRPTSKSEAKKLDKSLFNALKEENVRKSEQVLQKGADLSYESCNCCFIFGQQSSIAEANKRETLQALLHRYGCEDESLEVPEHIREKVKALERLENSVKHIEKEMEKQKKPFFQPRSMLPVTTAEDMRTSSLEWIQTLYRVLDEQFPAFCVLKEIYSQHSCFKGEAEVVLVLLDETTSRSQEVCDRFRELHRQGCKIIGVPMPGYAIADYSKWWPDKMLDFKDHSLFFDCRAGPKGDQFNKPWEGKMQKELLPQIAQFLEEWKKTAPGADESINAAAAAPGSLQEKVFESKQEMRDSRLPCPECLKQGKTPPGTFKRDDCMLFFLSKREGSNTKGMFFCFVCQTKVKVNHILKRPVFLSYNWGNNCSTQKIAKRLVERIFLATEMPYWLDVDGGMAFGDELVTEMKEGVAGCDIVVLMISDAFCNSGNCMFEFINIVENRKYVIPLLVPDRGGTRTGPSGWTGEYQGEDWWKHAQDICDPQRPDLKPHSASSSFKDIPWRYLAAFDPIDLRNESYQDDGSLLDNSPAENEIIRRIISRFFRSVEEYA